MRVTEYEGHRVLASFLGSACGPGNEAKNS